MITRTIIVNPMQSPPGVWLGKGRGVDGTRCVAFKQEEAAIFSSKTAAEIEAAHFAKNYPKRGNEELMFLHIESKE